MPKSDPRFIGYAVSYGLIECSGDLAYCGGVMPTPEEAMDAFRKSTILEDFEFDTPEKVLLYEVRRLEACWGNSFDIVSIFENARDNLELDLDIPPHQLSPSVYPEAVKRLEERILKALEAYLVETGGKPYLDYQVYENPKVVAYVNA